MIMKQIQRSTIDHSKHFSSLFWLITLVVLRNNWIEVEVTAYSTNPNNVKFDIMPPKLRSDWVQLSKLMGDCLQETPPNIINDISWILYQRYQTQQQIYQQLVRNARAMQDAKYTILLAKERPESGRGGNIIGMIEFGVVSMIQQSNTISLYPTPQRRLLMIGTICIDPQYRKMGIASALIQQCETIVQTQWKETEVYAHIEETNHMAIRCFTKFGYTMNISNSSDTRVDYISVRRRHKVERVPHLLFQKALMNDRSNGFP